MNTVELKPFNLVVCHPRGDFHFIRDCPLANKKKQGKYGEINVICMAGKKYSTK